MIAPALLLAFIAQAEGGAGPPAQPSSQPAVQAAGPAGTARDVVADLTIIFDVGEHELNVQENWALQSPSGRAIPPAELTIPTPAGARFLRLDEQHAKGFKASEDSRAIHATEPLPPSGKEFASGYIIDGGGSSVSLSRPIPFSIQHARIVVQDMPGLSINTNVQGERRTRDLNGVSYIVYDLAAMSAGSTLDITLDGLPARTLWPRRAAVAVVAAILLWMVWALVTRSVPGRTEAVTVSPLSAQARRDQLVKAIEVLERDLREEKVKAKKYERRKSELMTELALVLREMEMSDSAKRGARADV